MKYFLLSIAVCCLPFLAAAQNHWTPNVSQYDNYQTLTAYVILNGMEQQSSDIEVAGFVGGDCRGSERLIAAGIDGHAYALFLQVWGNVTDNGKPVTLKIYNHATAVEYTAEQTPVYEYNGTIGHPSIYQITARGIFTVTVNAAANGSMTANPVSALYGDTIQLSISPAQGYELSSISAVPASLVIIGAGNSRKFAMPASNVTLTPAFTKTADQLAVEAAKALLESVSYTDTQENIPDAAAAKAKVEAIISGLALNGVSATVVPGAFTPAVAGTPSNMNGTNGSYTFTVKLNRGNATEQTTVLLTLTVIATLYVPAHYDNTLHGITLNGQPLSLADNMRYVMPCGADSELIISFEAEATATVSPGRLLTVTVDKPQLKIITITVTSLKGEQSKTYTLTIERRFPFGQIVKMRWNNTLTVINNPLNNGGYTFTSYKWFRNGKEIATEQSWSAGAQGESLNPADLFYVEVTGNFEGTLRTCESAVSLRSMEVRAWPNPVAASRTLYVQADVDDELLEGAVIEVYNLSGAHVGQLKVQGQLTPVDVKYPAGVHIFMLKGKEGFSKELKVVVQ